ncbi:MAG: acyl-CoA dehydrogenase [Streptosporangiales bacterium]|nr:acyl-CoA dehydrogenase [Streptosporangiales bacterium]
MKFFVSEEQAELRGSVRRFMEDKSALAEVRRLMDTDTGYDPAVWSQMSDQLGLQGLHIPEEYGGAGFSFQELAVVMEEMGRALYCGPYLSSAVLATSALLTSGDEAAKKTHLPRIASGTIATLAFTEENGRWDADSIALAARPDGDASHVNAWVLDGVKAFVPDGHIAELILVAGRTASGISLFAVESRADGLTATALPTMDQTRKLARLDLRGVTGRLIGQEGGAMDGLTGAFDLAAVALAAEQVGAAQRCLDMSVEYAKVREQFDKPIGSFQAIKHKCADLLMEIESARSAAYYGAWAAAEGSEELPAVASLAKAYCSEAGFHAAAETIQIHGGIGFTWEHDAHLFFKRASANQLFLGTPEEHRERLAQRIGV